MCTECFNDFGTDLTFDRNVDKVHDSVRQDVPDEGWGAPLKPSIDKSKLYGMQWQFNNPGQNYDLWVDDVSFTGCP